MQEAKNLTKVLNEAKPYEIFEALASLGKENLEKLVTLNVMLTAIIKIINRKRVYIKIKEKE